MAVEVNVLRVFTDVEGKFGDLLGVVPARVAPRRVRQRIAAALGYSATVFVEESRYYPGAASAEIFTPAVDVVFASQAAVGAAWWLRELGMPIRRLQLRAGVVEVRYAGDLVIVGVSSQWTPEFVLHELESAQDIADADQCDYLDGYSHYLWAWVDQPSGHVRSRAFAPELDADGDEATGAAAVRATEYLSRDLIITQGDGSVIQTWCSPRGGIAIGGRAVHAGRRLIT